MPDGNNIREIEMKKKKIYEKSIRKMFFVDLRIVYFVVCLIL